jgi:hypothetical protein
VDDAVRVRRFERLGYLAGMIQDGGQGQRPAQRLPFHEFEHQVVQFLGLLQTVDRRDAGVIQRGQGTRLAPEARQPFRVAGELGRQGLDRHVPAEFAVVRPVDLAHSSRAQHAEDAVRPQLPSRQRPARPRPRRGLFRQHRLFQETTRLLVLRNEHLHATPSCYSMADRIAPARRGVPLRPRARVETASSAPACVERCRLPGR